MKDEEALSKNAAKMTILVASCLKALCAHLGANEAAREMIMMRRITETTTPIIIFF